jgi:protein subunit release factor B
MHFPVSESKLAALKKKMITLGIHESDLDEHFVRSGGRGGQNVNKVETCVVLIHRPSKISVKCQAERSQGLNRFIARQRLVEKIETQMLGRQSQKARETFKIKRQKKRRSRKTAEKLRKLKEVRAEKKQLRQRVGEE